MYLSRRLDGSINTMRPLVYVSRRLLSRFLSFVYFGDWVFCGIVYRGPVRLSAVSIVSTSPPALVRWPQSVRPHVRNCTDHYHLARRMRAGLLMRRPACLYLSLWLLVYLSACIPTHPTFVCDPPSHSLPPPRIGGMGKGRGHGANEDFRSCIRPHSYPLSATSMISRCDRIK